MPSQTPDTAPKSEHTSKTYAVLAVLTWSWALFLLGSFLYFSPSTLLRMSVVLETSVPPLVLAGIAHLSLYGAFQLRSAPEDTSRKTYLVVSLWGLWAMTLALVPLFFVIVVLEATSHV